MSNRLLMDRDSSDTKPQINSSQKHMVEYYDYIHSLKEEG